MAATLGVGVGITDIPVTEGGEAVLDPASISGIIMNLDAQDLASITKDGSNRVSAWNDLSGNDLHALQANPTFQPLYSATGLNGKPALIFDGSRGLGIVDNVLMNHTGMSLLCVGAATADDDTNQHELFRKWSGSTNREFRGFVANNGNTVQFGFTTAGSGGIFNVPAVYNWTVNNGFLMSVRDNTTNTTTYINDNEDSDTDAGTIFNSTADMVIGLAGGNTNVAIGQFIWYNNNIADEDYDALVAMLIAKWNIT